MSISSGSSGNTFTDLTIGDLYIYENIITGRSDLSTKSIFLVSNDSGYIGMYGDVYVGGTSTGPNMNNDGTYDGSDFSVFGSYDASNPTTQHGMFWTAGGDSPNTLKIYGNITVYGNTATFDSEDLTFSDSVITLGIPEDSSEVAFTTKDIGIEFKWNNGAVITQTIVSISFYNLSSVIITTSVPHGYLTAQEVIISETDCIPSIDGTYNITVINDLQFIVLGQITSNGTTGTISKTFNTGFFGFDKDTTRFKYYSECNNVNDVFTGIVLGDMEINNLYVTDSVYIGSNENNRIYTDISDNLIIENGGSGKDIIFNTTNGVTTSEIMRITDSDVLISTDNGVTIGSTGQLTIDVDGTTARITNNETNGSINFITKPGGVETSTLYLDGTTGYVGINTVSPSSELDVNGTLSVSGALIFGNSTTDGSWKYIVESDVLNLYKRVEGNWVLKQTYE